MLSLNPRNAGSNSHFRTLRGSSGTSASASMPALIRSNCPLDESSFAGSEVRTACQQACPTQAIAFGSLDDAQSPMVAARNTRRAYAVLDDLGTEPRVRYLARVRNANPDLEPSA